MGVGDSVMAVVNTAQIYTSNVDPYFSKLQTIYRSTVPPKPDVLQGLVKQYPNINSPGNQNIRQKAMLVQGPHRRNNQLILMAIMMKELMEKGDFVKCMGEDSKTNLQFWVYLFQQAKDKYTGYWSSNLLYSSTKDGPSLSAQLQSDFFSDCPAGAKFTVFKEGYDRFTGPSSSNNEGDTQKKQGGGTRRQRKYSVLHKRRAGSHRNITKRNRY